MPISAKDSYDELSYLVRQLHDTQQRLQELAGNQIDSILHPTGQSYLLRQAQEKLRENESDFRRFAETQSAILNALPAHVALLNQEGVIISVNDRWRDFGVANGVLASATGEGQNYVETCERATGPGSDHAHAVAAGIRAILSGASTSEFALEYPCHSPTEQRWFMLRANPLHKEGPRGAVIMHTDITAQKKSEKLLFESQRRLALATESARMGIWDWDVTNNDMLWDENMYALYGIAAENLTGAYDAWQKGLHPEDRARVQAEVADAVSGIKEFHTEFRIVWPDGEVRNIEAHGIVQRADDGTAARMIGVNWDITERKRAEHRVAEQIKLMEMASAVGKLGAWAVEYPGPKIVWSKEVYRLHDLDPGYPLDMETAFSFFAPASQKKLRDATENGRPFDLELDFTSAKGKKRKTRAVSDVEMKNGSLFRFFGILQDITEQKRIEARFRRLADSNAQGVIFYDVRGKIIQANDAFLRIVGYSQEDLEAGDFDWISLTPPEWAEADRRALNEIATAGCCRPYEKEYIRKDGTRVPILLGSAAFEDDPDEGVCFVLDLTERKKFEQQFLRSQRMDSIGALAGGIAHDLNNVLAPILMSIEYLKMKSTDEQNLKTLDTIEKNAERAADLVRQVLSFARGVEGQRVAVNLLHVLRDLVTVITETFPKSIFTRFTPKRDLWRVVGDPTQLHQVFLNLCVNARDALPLGGNLSIGIENVVVDEAYAAMNAGARPGPYVMVTVEDSGEGIPDSIRDRIFEPFFTTKNVGKGTGLGLSTTLSIVKSHGGFINLNSKVGSGTTFKVYLPAQPATEPLESVAEKQTNLPRGNGEWVLVVEDEEPIRKVALQTLEGFGYQTLLASNGAEAVSSYLQHQSKIAVVITDMAMPIMDGPALIIALKSINPSIRIIGSSGLASKGEMVKAIGSGVFDFLEKPYRADDLLTTLHRVLHRERNPGSDR